MKSIKRYIWKEEWIKRNDLKIETAKPLSSEPTYELLLLKLQRAFKRLLNVKDFRWWSKKLVIVAQEILPLQCFIRWLCFFKLAMIVLERAWVEEKTDPI